MNILEQAEYYVSEMENTWFMQNYNMDKLGSRLSKELNCGVRYCPINKGFFICNCKIMFSIDEVSEGNWTNIIHKHEEILAKV
jgi:hypothetical protein